MILKSDHVTIQQTNEAINAANGFFKQQKAMLNEYKKNILEKEPLDPYDTKEAIRRLEQYLRVKYPAKFELK